jgi:hypothetical protein
LKTTITGKLIAQLPCNATDLQERASLARPEKFPERANLFPGKQPGISIAASQQKVCAGARRWIERAEESDMILLIILIVLIFGFGYGGYRVGPGWGYYGGGGISLILTIVLILLLLKVI